MGDLWAVIMAGGRGVRLWPLSREARGKQFLALAGEKSLLREAAERVEPLTSWERMLVVLGRDQVGAALNELPEIPPERFLAEPARRNTAAAVGLALSYLSTRAPEATMLVLPADHVVSGVTAFRGALRAAAAAAEDGSLVSLGIRPTRPETGYGYLELGARIAEHGGIPIHRATSFVEKPPREKAQALVAGGNHLWNSGIFVWKVSAIARALAAHLPQLHRGFLPPGRPHPVSDGEELEHLYERIPAVSIDYGVMEKEETVLVVLASFGWNDLGSWRALDDIWPADEAGNRVRGDLIAVDSRRVTLCGGARVVAAVGVEDLIIVDTPDALLVCSKDHSQEVRAVVDRLSGERRRELL